MIAGIAATPFDRLPRLPHRRTVARQCGDYRPFSHNRFLGEFSHAERRVKPSERRERFADMGA